MINERFPFICILILNWNGAKITERCVFSVLNVTDYPKDKFKISVIDNGSDDESVSYLKNIFSDQIEIIALDKNYYFILGNNKGIISVLKRYNPEYILLLNNDTEIFQEKWLKELVKTAEENSKVGIVGPRLIFPNGRVQWSGRKKESNILPLIFQTISAGFNPGVGKEGLEAKCSQFVGEVNTISGACMLIKSELFDKLGLLDERLFPMFQEDVEYCFRADKAGYDIFYRGDIDIIHLESYSINQTGKYLRKKKAYWALRNSMIVSRLYFGLWNVTFCGIPIFIAATLLDKKDKTNGLRIGNIKIRDDAFNNIGMLLKAIRLVYFRKLS